MGRPAYIYTNLVEAAAGLSSSTEDAAYPLVNIYNRIKAHPFKFTTTAGYVEVDLGSSIAFDTVAVIGHDATAMGGTVKAGATANPSTTVGTFTHRTEDVWVSASATAQYVRVTLSGDLQDIGELVIGTRVLFPRQARWGIVTGDQASGVTHRTYGGVTWDYESYEFQIVRVTFRFPQSEYETFRLFSRRVARNPFVYIPDVAQATLFYVKKARSYLPQPVAPGVDTANSNPFAASGNLSQWYDWTVDMEAESLGLSVMA